MDLSRLSDLKEEWENDFLVPKSLATQILGWAYNPEYNRNLRSYNITNADSYVYDSFGHIVGESTGELSEILQREKTLTALKSLQEKLEELENSRTAARDADSSILLEIIEGGFTGG